MDVDKMKAQGRLLDRAEDLIAAQAQEIQELRADRDKSEAEVKRLCLGLTDTDRQFRTQFDIARKRLAEIQDLRAQLADRTAEVQDLDRALEQLELERQKVRDKLVRARRLNWVNRHETANLIQDLRAQLASERQTNLELGALAIKRKAQLKDAVENEDRLRTLVGANDRLVYLLEDACADNTDLRSQRDALLEANDELRRALGLI